MSGKIVIAVDFDGTVVAHRYPLVGPEVPHAVRWLREFVRAGADLILWTMRSSGRSDGTDPLADAVAWYESRGIPLYGVNSNPSQSSWTASPKAYANLYIDDAAIGCPLVTIPELGRRPVVDWQIVGPIVLKIIKAQ